MNRQAKRASTPVTATNAARPKTLPIDPSGAALAQRDLDREADELALIIPVERRKPRLAWHGWDRQEAVASVPTQVVEIVRPGRSIVREGDLPGLGVRRTSSPPKTQQSNGKQLTPKGSSGSPLDMPDNRLIWTNDNIVALQTLLDDCNPTTDGYRYRGKIDLIYIDPPFMVNNDFRADNSIDIELDDADGVEVKKEPSLVEILAYKDTWRQGLDSFLSMMRERLVLLRDLLAPTGSIYVHLDWHAVHYVKVLMDEIFGYENFRNEITWRRANAHNDPARFGMITDTILFYAASDATTWNDVHVPYSSDYISSHWRRQDAKGRYRLIPLDAPRHGDGGNLVYEWKGKLPARSRTWAYLRPRMAEFEASGLIEYTSTGTPNLKRYLNDTLGVPAQNL
jgi:hypothetical protein